MKNGQDAAELPRRKRGRPPGSRKTTSKSEQKSSEPRNEQLATIGTSSEKRWNSDEGTSSLYTRSMRNNSLMDRRRGPNCI